MKTILLALAGIACHAATITSGSINFTGLTTPPTFAFQTDDFGVTGSFRAGIQSSECHPCVPGDRLGIYGVPDEIYGGTVAGSGVWWTNRNAPPSRFEWSGPSIVITGPGTYASTFSLTGQLCGGGGQLDAPTCPYLFAAVTGSGSVEATIITGGAYLWLQSATFTFEPAQSQSEQAEISNPEPATGMLVAAMLLGIAIKARRKATTHNLVRR